MNGENFKLEVLAALDAMVSNTEVIREGIEVIREVLTGGDLKKERRATCVRPGCENESLPFLLFCKSHDKIFRSQWVASLTPGGRICQRKKCKKQAEYFSDYCKEHREQS